LKSITNPRPGKEMLCNEEGEGHCIQVQQIDILLKDLSSELETKEKLLKTVRVVPFYLFLSNSRFIIL
jgi:hypothetical protein